MRSYFRPILAQKQMRERRTISLREVSRETDVALSLITRLANDTIQRVDLSDLARVCVYLSCDVGDLLKLEESEAMP